MIWISQLYAAPLLGISPYTITFNQLNVGDGVPDVPQTSEIFTGERNSPLHPKDKKTEV